ncbi:MAG: isochorismatase family protein [Lentisphaeraceae bacterium]|nr:isochorismatase family protein [Lentisphaeraceae bacterium]
MKTSNPVLVVVDLQEKLVPIVENSERMKSKCFKAFKAHSILGFPVSVTEQYPQGLGKTLQDFEPFYSKENVFAKTRFSSFGAVGFEESLSSKEVVLIGIEAHVCVYQTCLDALEKGFSVTVLVDCISSRSEEDRAVAIRNMEKVGASLSTFESYYLGLIGDAKHPHFKELSKLLKD